MSSILHKDHYSVYFKNKMVADYFMIAGLYHLHIDTSIEQLVSPWDLRDPEII